MPSQSLWVAGRPADELGAKLRALANSNAAITASTLETLGPDHRVASIVENHAYTLEGAEQRGGNWYVKLRNPWGMFEPAGNGKNDGSFEMSLADFQRAFTAVDWVQ